MGNALDVLVDGESVTEALLLERTPEGEQLIYSGRGSLRALHEILLSIVRDFGYAEYCIVCFPDKKYAAIRLSPEKHLILAMDKEVPAERYIAMILEFFERLRSMPGEGMTSPASP
ncbi:MAG: hypothetical protein J7L98_05775 [Candidatus Verstraetearchaeota archaeon]|nr:hypothetical protein [Candidatus Verstraetearchaeota archaeon]